MTGWILFLLGSLIITVISIPSLRHPLSHGFFRFFAWEITWGMLFLNIPGWFYHPLAWHQVISWFLLVLCLVPLVWGLILLRSAGKPSSGLETTTTLVEVGIYRYIRHPLYASLLLLAWGIFFKSPSLLDACLAVVASAFLFATARADEVECLQKFGPAYQDYMRRTRRFIPFLF